MIMKPFEQFSEEEKIKIDNNFTCIKLLLQNPFISNLLDFSQEEYQIAIDWEKLFKLMGIFDLKKIDADISVDDTYNGSYLAFESYHFTTHLGYSIVSINHQDENVWFYININDFDIESTSYDPQLTIINSITVLLMIPNTEMELLQSYLVYEIINSSSEESYVKVNGDNISVI